MEGVKEIIVDPMYVYPYSLRSLKDSISFNINSSDYDTAEAFFIEFLSLFPGVLDKTNEYQLMDFSENTSRSFSINLEISVKEGLSQLNINP